MKKNMKKIMALALAATMTLGMTTMGMAAQTVGTAADNTAKITIQNAAKSETYKVYKLFDASVTGTQGGSISYTREGGIPDGLTDYFEINSAGNIYLKDGATITDSAMQTALRTWALGQNAIAEAISDGQELEFVGLPYGYYIVLSSQAAEDDGDGYGSAITVTSTNPTATIYDKNETTPSGLTKSADETNVFIGDTVTYTVKFNTSNYDGAGSSAKAIKSYEITDIPENLENIVVTGLTVGGENVYATGTAFPQFDEGEISIDWRDSDGTFIYENGAEVVLTYTAVVAATADIDGDGNTNTVSLEWTTEDGPGDGKLQDSETIYTYAIALKKVDQSGNSLAGATFQFPFYVKTTVDTDGAYIYAGKDAGDGLTDTITTPATGEIVVKGVASGTYSITETEAPAGYNKLTTAVEVKATQTGETTTNTTTYLDGNGNIVKEENSTTSVTYTNDKLATGVVVVVNKTGSQLPETGGMGTTIFYVLGSIMALGAGVLLVTKKRVGEN